MNDVLWKIDGLFHTQLIRLKEEPMKTEDPVKTEDLVLIDVINQDNSGT